jgi:hypothetical protein
VPVAVINGTMLTPGVSLNRRLYTPKVIAKMVARAQGRIADPNSLPIIMRTHHEAGDNSRLIVGKVTAVNLEEDGSATYQAQLYGTQPGKDIATLVTDKDPALKSVSISGGWLGPVKTVEYKGQTVETGDDLEIDAVDFTATPGVVGALIARSAQVATESAVSHYTPISESYEATMTVTEDAPLPVLEADGPNTKPYGDVKYADPGKQPDGVKRYPLDTAAHVKAAWSYINMPKNAAKYSSGDLTAIKGRIKAAMAKFGMKVSSESVEPRYGEIREYYPEGPGGEAGLCIDAYSGPLSVTFRACGLDPSSLKAVGAAAMTAATGALAALDPDTDGDIDVIGAPAEDDDNDMGSPAAYGGESVDTELEGIVLTEEDIGRFVDRLMVEMAKRGPAVTEAASPDDDMESAPGSSDDSTGDGDMPPTTPPSSVPVHTHTHDASDATMQHTHGHVHTHETAGDPYSHTHGHTHAHLPGGDDTHDHTHDHDHATAPSDTHESSTEMESAVSETENIPAAEAAPVQAVTLEHVVALTQAITALTDAVKTAPVAATAEAAPEVPAVTEAVSAPVVEPQQVLSFEEARKEMLNGLRSDILKEFGLPTRNGYRTTESTDAAMTPEQERADAWQNRTALLLGSYGQTPVPIPGTGIAATS